MKHLFLLAVLLFSVSSFARGGDLGGGGSGRGTGGHIRPGFILTAGEIRLLRSQPNLEGAYRAWIRDNEDPMRREEILQQVFKYHIVPQLQ